MKFVFSRSRLGVALAATLAISVAAPAFGAPPRAGGVAGEAEAHFQRGLELHQEQDFAGALVEFRRSYELVSTYKMLYNIGQVCYQLTDYACALRSFEGYLREGDAAVPADRRAEVDREVRKLRARVGRLEIVTNVPGVEISVDDVSVGTTPLHEPVVVSSGKRRVTGIREGYAPVTRFIEVAGADATRVVLVFTAAGPDTRPAGPPERESRWNTLSWLGLGATAAFAGAAGVTGVLAFNASKDLKEERYAASVGPTEQMRSDQGRTRTLATASDVLLGLSAVTLATTLVYTFVHTPPVVEGAKGESAPAKLGAGVSPGGAFVFGSF